MNDLAMRESALPDTIEDLAKFVLIAPEKAAALRAEIRAIKKLGVAQEVYQQKMDEQRQLSNMILDAEIRMGELTKAIPRATKGNQYTGKMVTDTAVAYQKPKKEVIRDLGFTPKQVERFETLADNKDLVEQVKAEAEAAGTIPTRTKVLDLAQERKKLQQRESSVIDADYDNLLMFHKAVAYAELYRITDQVLDSVIRVEDDLPETIRDLDRLTQLLTTIRSKLIAKGGNRNG